MKGLRRAVLTPYEMLYGRFRIDGTSQSLSYRTIHLL
jgi:hypothetical protein